MRLERRATPQQIAHAEGPRPGRAEQHEPEDHAEDPVVRLHEHRFLDRDAETRAAPSCIALEQLIGTTGRFVPVAALECIDIVVHLVLQVPRTEGKEQDQHGNRELRQPVQVRTQEPGKRRHRDHRPEHGEYRGRLVHRSRPSAGTARGPVEVTIEPAWLAQVQQVREPAFQRERQQQREQAHAGATSSSYRTSARSSGQSKAMPGSVLRPGATSL